MKPLFEHRERPYARLNAIAAAAAVALLISACGGGGGGGGGDLPPDQVMGNLNNKINVPGATVTQPTGTPPSAADNPDDTDPNAVPQVDPGADTVNTTPGQKVTIPVAVTTTTDLANLFAKVPGASTYFQAAFAGGGKALTNARMKSAFVSSSVRRPKGLTTINFEIDLPEDFPSGRFCFDFSAQDAEELTSETEQVCIVVGVAPTPTPAPTATPTPPPTTGKATDCFNPDLFAIGNRLELTQRATFGGETYTITQDLMAMRQTTFNGNTAIEVSGELTEESGGTLFTSESFKEYVRVDGTTLLLFGSTYEGTAEGSTISGEVTFEPPYENRYDLNPGQSYTQTYTFTSSATVDGQPFEFSETETNQTTFVGKEQITVPAGTFQACRFEQVDTIDGSSSSSSLWLAVGSGVPLRTLFDDGEDIVTLSASINGAPVNGD